MFTRVLTLYPCYVITTQYNADGYYGSMFRLNNILCILHITMYRVCVRLTGIVIVLLTTCSTVKLRKGVKPY
jgi:hypothetical protein